METPILSSHRGRQCGPRIIHLLPSSPPLVPVLTPDGEISPDVDRVLTMVAREAQTGDVAARNALFAACEPKIARFVRRYRIAAGQAHSCPAFDLEDIAQEAFVVFADLVDDWPGGDSFSAYFLGHFPWQLRNTVRHLGIANRASARFGTSAGTYLLADGSSVAAEAVSLVRLIAGRLPAPDGDILLWHILDGDSFGAIAQRLGTSRRTVQRAWDRIAVDLRRSLIA
jgi:RNA polymerase sigma factor (sigma-70 family)